jgi:hypothetical protein
MVLVTNLGQLWTKLIGRLALRDSLRVLVYHCDGSRIMNGKFYMIASFLEQKYLQRKSLHNVSCRKPSTHLRLLLKMNAEVPMQPYSVMAGRAKIITTFWAS